MSIKASPKKRKEVLLLRPIDHRGATLRVNQEADMGLRCDKHEGLEYLVYKHGPGWSFPEADRFLCAEGNPLTSYVTEDDEVRTASVPEFLKFAWGDEGEKLYNKLPDNLKQPLEGKWAATVTVKPTDLDPALGLDRLKAAAILQEHNIHMLEDFAQAEPKKDKVKDIISFLIPILLGFFAGVVFQLKGWF